MRFIALAVLAIASALAFPASAQDVPDRAARLAYISGPVSVYQDPELGWDKAYVNTPLTSENSVWTDSGARAEVRVGGTALRLDGQTQLDISRLDDDQLDAMVASGTLEATVRYKDARETFSISTPHARFYLQSDGRYRIDVDPERDESRLTVFRGDARMETSRGRVRVEPGRAVVVYGGQAEYVVEPATETRFDRWTATRDDQWRDTNSRRYVSSYMTGYEDLDAYGNWSQDPDYGAMWFPTAVSAGWTPYRDGRWAYVRPWGWTWVDDAPWGYAPSHYGRWVYARDRWGWAPGRRVDRPAWAPALVGWIGGSNWGVGASSGGGAPVGWYPLSPWERYEPWYRANTNHANRVNITVTNYNNPPRNWQGRGDEWRRWNRDHGTTVVQRDVLTDRRPVQNAVIPVTNQAIREQPRMQATQVQQALPQRNELARSRAGQQANVPAPIVARQPRVGGEPAVPQSQQTQQTPQGNAAVRPQFGRFAAPQAPAPAPANQPPQARQAQPVNPAARGEPSGQPVNPAARGDENARRAREAQQQQQQQLQQQQQQQAQQQQQQQAQERTQREAQQRGAQQRDAQQRDAQQREAQQRETQQRDAQQQQLRARGEQQQAQQREAQQREAAQQQQRARDAQQQQERAARDAQAQKQREAQQRDAAQQQQRARDAQAQQERAARDAQVQQQRALQQQQQAQERAAREAQQQAQQQAQRAQQAAREAQQQAQQQAQQRAAKEAQQQANPAARAEKAQLDKERENKDKEDKQK